MGWWVDLYTCRFHGYLVKEQMEVTQVQMHQHLVIDKNGNLQMETRSFPQSIERENAVKARYLELKGLKGEGQ